MLQALVTAFLALYGGKIEKGSPEMVALVVLLITATAITVMMALHANTMEKATGIKKANDYGNSEFKEKGCYAEYYTNVFGYIEPAYYTSNTKNFTWHPEFHNPDEKIEPKAMYKSAFRIGPRHFYMIVGSIVAGIHIIVYALVAMQGDIEGAAGAMSHLSSTLF